jgi:RNA polymerase sigma factor (sigma-70 family)
VTVDLDPLLPAIVAGDADAFGRFVAGAEARVRDSLLSFAAAIDVEAVLQEALLRVWQAAGRVVPDGRPQSLLRFAIRIARNLAISETRRRRPQLAVGEDGPEPSVVPETPDRLLREVIAKCHEKLPAQPARALQARLDGPWRADPEIAESLGMRTNTFLQNFTRARKLLAQCLADHGVDIQAELR